MKIFNVSCKKSAESGNGSHPLNEVEWSSQSQESVELSPPSLNASKRYQPSNKDSDSEESDCSFKSHCDHGYQKLSETSKGHLSQFSDIHTHTKENSKKQSS